MQNIVTIYRFNTPFLEIEKEKELLISVKNKINQFLIFHDMNVVESVDKNWDYNKVFLIYENILKMRLNYIKVFKNNYYIPVFKMDVYISQDLITWNEKLKKITLFLTSLFECFDGLNEKEYLIDIDKNIFYTQWMFSKKIYPSYDFQDISHIQKIFEQKKWEKILEDFLNKYKNNTFILSKNTSLEYHKIHSIILYYIYLVYIMYKSILDGQEILKELEDNTLQQENKHICLATQRLQHVSNINSNTFQLYYKNLEIFFSLFHS